MTTPRKRFKVNHYEGDPSYEHSLKEFFQKLGSLYHSIPEKERDKAAISFDYSHGYYDGVELSMSISYERDETDEEYKERLEKNALQAAKDREAAKKRLAQKNTEDWKMYERLKAKFEGQSNE